MLFIRLVSFFSFVSLCTACATFSPNKNIPAEPVTTSNDPVQLNLGQPEQDIDIATAKAPETQALSADVAASATVVSENDNLLSNKGELSVEGVATPAATNERGITTSNIDVSINADNSEEDKQVPPAVIWERIRKGFQLNLSQDNRRIKVQRDWYAKSQSYLNRTFNRAAPYLYHIVEEVDKRGLPMELALLPVVESAFDPFAYSHGRASGMWQFIPSTGRIYGMKQDWWYDGRRDIVASTDGALKYLTWLSGRFNGNWDHALASYNSGSGTVSKAIKRNKRQGKGTDFWSLKLPRETRAYVPKLIAISQIVADPAKYGVTLPDIEDKPYFEVVDTGSQIDLSQAASMAEIDLDLLYKLNPGFNRWATSPLGPHKLVLPLDKADIFKQNLHSLPKNQRVKWSRYTIKKGDSLISIARKHHTTPAVIRDINNIRGNTIRAGKTLLIPVARKQLDEYVLSSSARLQKTQNKYSGSSSATKIEYKVKRGDTFWDISRKYKVGVRQLAKWNGMAPRDPLKPGQTLVIWSKSAKSTILAATKPPADRGMIRKVNYRVRNGDSLARIANKFNVRIKDIVAWNGINPKSYLQPGQRLTLHVNIASGY